MKYSMTLAQIEKLKPCENALARIQSILPKRAKIDAAKARSLGCTYDDLIWISSAIAGDSEGMKRRLTAYLNDNAKMVLHVWEDQWPDDNTPRLAIKATDDFLAGQIDESEWDGARGARGARNFMLGSLIALSTGYQRKALLLCPCRKKVSLPY
jgi:hypothetical protein